MLTRIRRLAESQVSFAFESTMSSRSFEPFLRQCMGRGYQSNLVFLWLRSPHLAVARVADRVASGGHSVPEDVIHRRYWVGLKNFLHLYIPLADNWVCYDNSGEEPVFVSKGFSGQTTIVKQAETWQRILEMTR